MPDIGNLKCDHGKSPLKSWNFGVTTVGIKIPVILL